MPKELIENSVLQNFGSYDQSTQAFINGFEMFGYKIIWQWISQIQTCQIKMFLLFIDLSNNQLLHDQLMAADVIFFF